MTWRLFILAVMLYFTPQLADALVDYFGMPGRVVGSILLGLMAITTALAAFVLALDVAVDLKAMWNHRSKS